MSVLKFWMNRRRELPLSKPVPSVEWATTQVKEKPKRRRRLPPKKNGQTNGRWTSAEHKLFLQAYNKYGRDWKKVEEFVPSRSSTQIRSHAQRYLAKVQRENNAEYQQIMSENMDTLRKAPKVVQNTMTALQARYEQLARILAARRLLEFDSDTSADDMSTAGESYSSDDMSINQSSH